MFYCEQHSVLSMVLIVIFCIQECLLLANDVRVKQKMGEMGDGVS